MTTKTIVDSLRRLCQTSASSIHPLGKSFGQIISCFPQMSPRTQKNGGHGFWFMVMITLAEALDLSDSL